MHEHTSTELQYTCISDVNRKTTSLCLKLYIDIYHRDVIVLGELPQGENKRKAYQRYILIFLKTPKHRTAL